MPGVVVGVPRALLRLEAVLVAAGAAAAYGSLGKSWWWFAALFLAPDLSMAGYAAGKRAGAAVYNAAHWYGLPFACVAGGRLMHVPGLEAVGLIWAAHIAVDRALGFGLKYAEGFGFTHLSVRR